MSEPVGASVGSVSVTVTPDARGWSESVRRQTLPDAKVLGEELGRALGSAMASRFADSIDQMRLDLARLTAGRHDVDVRINAQGGAAAAAQIRAVGNAADGAGGSVGGMSSRFKLIAGAAVAASAVAIPALLAIGAAATAGVAVLGVGALGFSGIGAALQAHGKPSTGGGGGSASSGISAQQRALSARQATQAAEDRLAQATRNHADAVTALAAAQAKVTDAQKNLNDARKQAKQDLQDLDNKVKDNALAQKQAAIKLAEAKTTLARSEAAPGANLPQYKQAIAQAKLDVQTAQQQLNELKLQGSRLVPQDQQAHAAGVEGSAGVVAAKQKIVAANAGVTKAQRDLTVSSHDLAEAQQNIKDTALSNSLAAQKAGMASAAAGANQFAAAMAKLNPLQKQFVDFLLSLKPLWDQVKLAASGFLPGLEKGIKNALPAFQPFLKVVGNVAKAMGSVFERLGAWIGSTQGKQFLTWVSQVLPQVIEGAGNLFIGLFKTIATYGPKFWPLVEQLVSLVGQFMTTLGHLLLGLTPITKPIMDFLSSLFTQVNNLVKPVLMPLAKVVGDIFDALRPLLPVLETLIEAVLPPIARLLDAIVQGPLSAFIRALALSLVPVMPQINQMMVQLTDAFIALLPSLTQIMVALTPLIPIFTKLVLMKLQPFILGMQLMAKPMADIATLATKYLGPALNWLNGVMDKYMQVNQRVLNAVVGAWNTAYVKVKDWLSHIGSTISSTWSTAYGTVKGWIGNIVDVVTGLPGKIWNLGKDMLNAGKHLLDSLLDGLSNLTSKAGGFASKLAKSFANSMIYAVNHWVINPVQGAINWALNKADSLAGPWINFPNVHIPHIPTLAVGGLTNGLTAAILGDNPSGQEAVLPMDSPKTIAVLAKAMSQALAGGLPAQRPQLVGSGALSLPRLPKTLSNEGSAKLGRPIAIYVNGAIDPTATANAVARKLAAAAV